MKNLSRKKSNAQLDSWCCIEQGLCKNVQYRRNMGVAYEDLHYIIIQDGWEVTIPPPTYHMYLHVHAICHGILWNWQVCVATLSVPACVCCGLMWNYMVMCSNTVSMCTCVPCAVVYCKVRWCVATLSVSIRAHCMPWYIEYGTHSACRDPHGKQVSMWWPLGHSVQNNSKHQQLFWIH